MLKNVDWYIERNTISCIYTHIFRFHKMFFWAAALLFHGKQLCSHCEEMRNWNLLECFYTNKSCIRVGAVTLIVNHLVMMTNSRKMTMSIVKTFPHIWFVLFYVSLVHQVKSSCHVCWIFLTFVSPTIVEDQTQQF